MREIHTKEDFRYFVRADLCRYGYGVSRKAFRQAKKFVPGFRFTYQLRLCDYLSKAPVFKRPLFYLANARLERYKFKYGFDIEYSTKIGAGLHLSHWGGVVINPAVVIGENCNLSQQITIGVDSKEGMDAVPVIGSGVYIAPGSKIFGKITVGDNSAIGANSVVNRDVPPGVTVGGIPAKIISQDDASGYVHNIYRE